MSGAAVAAPDMEAGNQFRFGVRRDPKPNVAGVRLDALHGRDIALLRANEAPNFVDLQPAAGEIFLDHVDIMDPGQGRRRLDLG